MLDVLNVFTFLTNGILPSANTCFNVVLFDVMKMSECSSQESDCYHVVKSYRATQQIRNNDSKTSQPRQTPPFQIKNFFISCR